MASIRKRGGKTWYYRITDVDGIRREFKGCADKRQTELMAARAEAEADQVRRGLVDPRSLAYRRHEGRPILEHLDDYRRSLESKGGSDRHPVTTRNRAAKVLDFMGARRIGDLTLSGTQAALQRLRAAKDLNVETVNHHVRAVKGFSRWLHRDGRARDQLLQYLSTQDPEQDRRRVRRALSADEAARLIEAALTSKDARKMIGPDRARLYLVAMATGFRASELATLTPERFDLRSDPPTATVEAGYTKNGRRAVQPLPKVLAGQLRPWVESLPPGGPVFAIPTRTSEMIRADLVAARIPYRTEDGFADFHSLRGIFISNLVASGASVKVCQVLARHSTPVLTIGRYARAALQDVRGAVEQLPDPTVVRDVSVERALDVSPFFPHQGFGTMRNHAGLDDPGKSIGPPAAEISTARNGSEVDHLFALTEDEVQCRRWGSNPHGGSPLEDFKSEGGSPQTATRFGITTLRVCPVSAWTARR